MTDNLVGLDAYARSGGQGFENSNASELSELQKALEAGQTTGRDNTDSLTASGAPLKVESLESNLKVLEYKMEDIVLWKNIPKQAAYNTVEEYNRLVSYGTERGGFNGEGELPIEEDSVYQRKAQLVKFLGTTRSVSHVMSLVKVQAGVGDAINRENQNGMMWLLRTLNRALHSGDSGIIPVEFNGLYQQHKEDYATPTAYYNSNEVIDLRSTATAGGDSLSEGNVEEGVRRVVDAFGSVDSMFAPPIVLSNFVKTFYGNLRQFAPVPADSTVGRRVTTFQSQFGEVSLNFDKFMNKLPSKTTASSATSNRAPSAPTVGGAPAAAVTDAENKFAAHDAGDYHYLVTALNRYGESAPLFLTTGGAVTVTATESIDLQFVDGGGTDPATAYRVYRTKVDGASTGEFYPLFEVSVAELAAGYDGAAATKVRDRNHILPDTDVAFALEKSDEIFSFKQLAPMMKMDLALIAPAYRWMILCYGTPVLYQPKKMIRFINIGSN